MVTATSGNTIVFEADWLERGVLMMSLAPGEFDEQTVLRSRVFLSAIDQVLGDDPPRKPFDSLIASGRFGLSDVVADLADLSPAKSRAGRPMTRSSSMNAPDRDCWTPELEIGSIGVPWPADWVPRCHWESRIEV